MEEQDLSFILVGMQNGTAISEDILSVSYKPNILLPYNHAPCFLPKGTEKT